MKKLLIIISLLIFLMPQANLMAQQEDDEDVIFNAILAGAFDLIILDGINQTATFTSATDYNIGVSETQGLPGIDPGFTTIAMEATGNWNMKISAPDFSPTSGTGSIPIGNLGVWCEATGVHQFGTEVACSHQSADAAHGLTTTDYTFINLLTDNSGDQTDNQFVLHWLMGTMQGTMTSASMFSQLSDGLFTQGTYTTTVVLTMTELP